MYIEFIICMIMENKVQTPILGNLCLANFWIWFEVTIETSRYTKHSLLSLYLYQSLFLYWHFKIVSYINVILQIQSLSRFLYTPPPLPFLYLKLIKEINISKIFDTVTCPFFKIRICTWQKCARCFHRFSMCRCSHTLYSIKHGCLHVGVGRRRSSLHICKSL